MLLLQYSFIQKKKKKNAQNTVACNELPCTDLQCWKSLVLKLMKLIWPTDSSSPIDLSLFQLLCTSQRLIKINPAAKLGWNAFSFSVFLFFFRSAFWLSVKVWRTRPRLGAWENVFEIQVGCWSAETGRSDETWRAHDKHQRADGLRWGWFHSWHEVQAQGVIDAHGSTETQHRAICFDLRLIICQRGDGTLSIRAFLSNCSSHLCPNKALQQFYLISRLAIALLFFPCDAV